MEKNKFTEHELKAFVNGFTEALLWTSYDCDEGGDIIEEDLRGYDVTEQGIKSANNACREFLENCPRWGDTLEAYRDAGKGFEQMGHDFLLTRNGHGAGFWARDWLPDDLREILTDYSDTWCECYAFKDGENTVGFDCVSTRRLFDHEMTKRVV